MKPPPASCSSCGGLVEVDALAVCPLGHKHPVIEDRRIPPGRHVCGPMLCWSCRGAVLLGCQ